MNTLYVRLNIDYFDDPKIMSITPLARLQYAACLLVAKRYPENDGQINSKQLWRQQPDLTIEEHVALLAELASQNLLERVSDDNYRIVQWLKWNKSGAEVDQIRQDRAEAGRHGGRRSAASRAAKAIQAEPETFVEASQYENDALCSLMKAASPQRPICVVFTDEEEAARCDELMDALGHPAGLRIDLAA